jgi:hypothetical protein
MVLNKVKVLTLELWNYMAENPGCRSKRDVPEDLYQKIHNFSCWCPLCEVFGNGCEFCPLKVAGECCSDENSAYDRWVNSMVDDVETREESALRIVEIISAWDTEK